MKSLAFALLFAAGASAGYADNCGLVIDQAGVLSEAQTTQVVKSAQPLLDKGAEVHIITLPHLFAEMEGTSLTDRFKSLAATCPSWIPGNLVAFVVAPNEGQTALFYGPNWKRLLDRSYERILAKQMDPFFAKRDWTGGLVAAERAVLERLQLAQAVAEPAQNKLVRIATRLAPWCFWFGIGFLMMTIVILFRKRQRKSSAGAVVAPLPTADRFPPPSRPSVGPGPAEPLHQEANTPRKTTPTAHQSSSFSSQAPRSTVSELPVYVPIIYSPIPSPGSIDLTSQALFSSSTFASDPPAAPDPPSSFSAPDPDPTPSYSGGESSFGAPDPSPTPDYSGGTSNF